MPHGGPGDQGELGARRPEGKDLSAFPEKEYARGELLYRCHSIDWEAWYFASDMNSRFDLSPPLGTCYLVRDKESALRESLGETLTRAAVTPVAELERRRVSRLRLPHDVRAADTAQRKAATYGITRELTGDESCTLPQKWAAALRRARFGGLSYENRFDPSRDAESLALFGRSGPKKYRADKHPQPGTDAAIECGMVAADDPVLARLTVTKPPRYQRSWSRAWSVAPPWYEPARR